MGLTTRWLLLVGAVVAAGQSGSSAGAYDCNSEAVCRDCGDGCTLLEKISNTTDEGACCAACVALDACTSWTLNLDSQECHLKDTEAPVSGGTCISGATAGLSRPHILLITSDQQRIDTVSAYQGDRGVPASGVRSPNFDKLAAQGVRWTEAFATSPVCSPCRTSLLTGVHVPVHGVLENTVSPHKDGLTVYPDVLASKGYVPMIIGKTHFTPCPDSFAFQDVHSGNTDMRCFPDKYAEGNCNWYNENDFLETYLVNQTITQLGWHLANTSAPFFVHLSFVSPHPPSTPPHPWDTRYEESDLPPINYQAGDIDALPYQTRMLLGLLDYELSELDYLEADGASLNQSVVSQERRLYHGLTAYVDEQLGRAADWIDDQGLATTTLLIFTSDHGSMLYDHGAPNDKHSFLEASWHVPMLMRQPGVLPANVTNAFATTIDITASILAAAGVDWEQTMQEEPTAGDVNVTFFMSGIDLYTPLASGGAEPRTAVAATEYRGYAVATRYWKLIYMAEQGEGRLFDRENDVLERIDLWDEPAYAAVKSALLVGLLRWRAQQDDLQYQLTNWDGAAEVGVRARNDSTYISGRVAEKNVMHVAEEADSMWPVA